MSPFDLVMDAQAANQMQARAYHNPDTPELDSLVELVLAAPLPLEWKKRLLASAQQINDWNESEARCQLQAIRALDAQAPQSLRDTIGVRGAAQRLRPAFAAERKGDQFAVERMVRRLVADPHCGPRVLRSRSMSGQLGCDQYARLLALLDREEAMV